MNTDERTTSHWPLPTRSSTDRKLGGVAGGLGRAWKIDPLLIRVAFVVLALFGGSGVLLYSAGWLAMRGDGDEVSALEALAGRGKSSVSPALSVVLIVVALASMGSIFSWGMPFWPVLIAAAVIVALVWHGPSGRRQSSDEPGQRWERRVDEFAERAGDWGQRAGDWVERWLDPDKRGRQDGNTAGEGTGSSPTDGSGDSVAENGETSGTPEQADANTPHDSASAQGSEPSPEDLLHSGRRTPPAWDPLGAAPFAWDLPEPTSPSAAAEDVPASKNGRAIGRLVLGLTLIVGSISAAGIASGWWTLPWAGAAGITLAVLASGMFVAALSGRNARMLIGPGIFVAVLTLGLTVTGIAGTGQFGQQTWTPTSLSTVADSYTWNGGQATLDLSHVDVPRGETLRTDVTIGGGQVVVILPADTDIEARCSVSVGQLDCLGARHGGVRAEQLAAESGDGNHGLIDIDVHSNAGQAVLKIHE